MHPTKRNKHSNAMKYATLSSYFRKLFPPGLDMFAADELAMFTGITMYSQIYLRIANTLKKRYSQVMSEFGPNIFILLRRLVSHGKPRRPSICFFLGPGFKQNLKMYEIRTFYVFRTEITAA